MAFVRVSVETMAWYNIQNLLHSYSSTGREMGQRHSTADGDLEATTPQDLEDGDTEAPGPETPPPHALEPDVPKPKDPPPPKQKKGWSKMKRKTVTNEEASEQRSDPNMEYVCKKIRRASPDMGDNKVRDLAECLCSQELFTERYFKPLLRRLKDAVSATFDEGAAFAVRGYPNDRTKAASTARMASEIDRVKAIQVELLLYELQGQNWQKIARLFHRFVPDCTYGPYHAALKIGDLILEWDDDSLIIPREETFTATAETAAPDGPTLIFRATVHDKTGQNESAIDIPTRGGAEATAVGFDQHANHLLDITEEKEHLLDALAEMIVRYNTKFEYGVFSCNCQYFAAEMLSALGIEDQAEHFQRTTKDLFAKILLKRSDKVDEFNTHAELDEYVREHIDTMDHEDLQFCHCHYLLFHAWRKQSDKKVAWRCDPSRCMSNKVASKIDPQ